MSEFSPVQEQRSALEWFRDLGPVQKTLSAVGVLASAAAIGSENIAHAEGTNNIAVDMAVTNHPNNGAYPEGFGDLSLGIKNNTQNCYNIEVQIFPTDRSDNYFGYGDTSEAANDHQFQLRKTDIGQYALAYFYDCNDHYQLNPLGYERIKLGEGEIGKPFEAGSGPVVPTTPGTTPTETTPVSTTPVETTPVSTTPTETTPVVITPPVETPKPPVVVVVPPKQPPVVVKGTCDVPVFKKNETVKQAIAQIKKDIDCRVGPVVGHKGKIPRGKKLFVRGFATTASPAIREVLGAKAPGAHKVGNTIIVPAKTALKSGTVLSPYVKLGSTN